MKRHVSEVAMIAGLLLGGCTPDKEPKSVQYYAEHPEERKTVVAQCKNNPGKYRDDPDCINAETADIRSQGKGPSSVKF